MNCWRSPTLDADAPEASFEENSPFQFRPAKPEETELERIRRGLDAILLDGEIELTVAGRDYTASAGDSFLFRSERPHSFRNKGTCEARVVWINTPPTF